MGNDLTQVNVDNHLRIYFKVKNIFTESFDLC